MKIRILFIDDDPLVLSGLRRSMHPMREEWEMVFAESGATALALMEQSLFDVVVSDMRMPLMNGAELLAKAMEKYPNTLRFILSGHSDHEMTVSCATTAHQFLSKPCDSEILKEAIHQALSVKYWLDNKAVLNLVSKMGSIPSVPAVYNELSEVLNSPDISIEKIGEIIARDIGMTAKVLQLVNSAFFGARKKVSSPAEAALFLGVETLKALFLTTHIFDYFKEDSVADFSLSRFSNHSLETSQFASKIVEMAGGNGKMREAALSAGMLHDMGKLILAVNLPQDYNRSIALAKEKQIPFWQAEQELLGVGHAEVGAYLLGLWGLPNEIVEAVAFHHHPANGQVKKFSALTAVHVANYLQLESRCQDKTIPDAQLDETYLAELGLSDRIQVWRETLTPVKTD